MKKIILITLVLSCCTNEKTKDFQAEKDNFCSIVFRVTSVGVFPVRRTVTVLGFYADDASGPPAFKDPFPEVVSQARFTIDIWKNPRAIVIRQTSKDILCERFMPHPRVYAVSDFRCINRNAPENDPGRFSRSYNDTLPHVQYRLSENYEWIKAD